jgi:putative SOS response-associated peptidase YedK
MPAILRGDEIDAWLNTRDVTAEIATSLAVSPPSGTMKYHPVGKAIGAATAEGPELILPASGEEEAAPKPEKRAGGGRQLDLF